MVGQGNSEHGRSKDMGLPGWVEGVSLMRTSRYKCVCVRQYQTGLGWAKNKMAIMNGRIYVAYFVKNSH